MVLSLVIYRLRLCEINKFLVITCVLFREWDLGPDCMRQVNI